MIRVYRSDCLYRSLLTILAIVAAALSTMPVTAEHPVSLHPENSHYLLFRGRPTVLITSGEHYGAVLNADFNAMPYLDELQSCEFNLTRLFTGVYCEVPESFGIKNNSLAPASGRLLCPWARSSMSGNATEGNKFDLDRWDPAYFARLRDFVAEAGQRGIVVELTLFCPFYVDEMWNRSPMNAVNNINGIGNVERTEVYTLKHANLVALHERMTRKVIEELNGFDNLYYEICNEPYFGGVTTEWQDRIAETIANAEARLPNRHLVAQNIANGSQKIENPNPAVSIFNFHYASPPDAVTENYSLHRALGDDETGSGTDRTDFKYRAEGWEFVLAGGAIYDNLDFSFAVGHERGDAVTDAPGGGGVSLRAQLKILKNTIERLDFVKMAPDNSVLRNALPPNVAVRVLAEHGHQYLVYVRGDGLSELAIDLPPGRYQAEWINTKTVAREVSETREHTGGSLSLLVPQYTQDIALRIKACP